MAKLAAGGLVITGLLATTATVYWLYKNNSQSASQVVEQPLITQNDTIDNIATNGELNTQQINMPATEEPSPSTSTEESLSNDVVMTSVPEVSQNLVALASEVTTIYRKMKQVGSMTDEDKTNLNNLQEKIKTYPSKEIAKLVFEGFLDTEVLELIGLELDPEDFVPLQNYRHPSLVTLEESGSSIGKAIQFQSTEMGLSLSHFDQEGFVTYLYDDIGHFTGVLNLNKSQDNIRFLSEQVSGVDVQRFGGSTFYLIRKLRTSATFYIQGRSLGYAQIHLEEINAAEPLLVREFPVSSSTLVAVRLEMIDGVLHVGKWNFDFDGDNKTDITLGNGEVFSEAQLKLAIELMRNDTKLSEADRSALRSNTAITIE